MELYEESENREAGRENRGKGRVTRYGYDANGRLVKTERADGSVETRSYDAPGRLIRQTDRLGSRVLRDAVYGYDARGNLTEIRGGDEAGPAGEGAEMTYDGNNRLLTWNGETVRYDTDGNMI